MTYQDPFKVYSTPPSTSFIRGINVLFHTYRLIFNPFTDFSVSQHRIPSCSHFWLPFDVTCFHNGRSLQILFPPSCNFSLDVIFL